MVDKAEVAASFQQAVVDILVSKSIQATLDKGYRTLVLCGGVSANSMLRKTAQEEADKNHISLYYPPLALCTDNAAMIGSAGFFRWQDGKVDSLALSAKPNLKIGD